MIAVKQTFLFLCILSMAHISNASDMRSVTNSVETEQELFHRLSKLDDDHINIDEAFISYITKTNQQAIHLLSSHRLEEAEAILSHAIDMLSQYPRLEPYKRALYCPYGMFYMNLGNYKTAERYLYEIIDFWNEYSIPKDENYGGLLSLMAVCHSEIYEYKKAQEEILEAIDIIENSQSKNNAENLFPAYQKAGTVFKKSGMNELAKEYTLKAFNLLDENDNSQAAIYTINNLAVEYLNDGNYSEAMKLLKVLESKDLTEFEKADVYENLFMASYLSDNEADCIKYAKLSSQCRINESEQLFSSVPVIAQDDLWNQNAMKLLANMSILDKYHDNNEAIELCYDIILLSKRLSIEHMTSLHSFAKKDSTVLHILSQIKMLKSLIFSGFLDDNQIHTTKEQLYEAEKSLIETVRTKSDVLAWTRTPTWNEVRKSLNENEYAVEFIVYGGYTQEDDQSEIRYAGLVLSSQNSSPIFVDLCSGKELEEVYSKALRDKEFGINQLYKFGQGDILYHLIWEKLERFIPIGSIVYLSPFKHLQKFNLEMIPCPDNSYLADKYTIQTLTSTASICNKPELSKSKDAVVYGGIDYSELDNKHDSSLRSFILDEGLNPKRDGFSYLPYSDNEADSIANILIKNNYMVSLYKSNYASEETFVNMDGKSPSIIHIASHTFHLDSSIYSDRMRSYLGQFQTSFSIFDYSMILSGLLFANAYTTLTKSREIDFTSDGIITAEEISFLDLSNTNLAVISACASGDGYAMKEGYGGLVKAFKMAGVNHLLVSLWPVSDEATSIIMTIFYKYMLNGVEMHAALQKTRQEIAKLYPDPYYWASFILLD